MEELGLGTTLPMFWQVFFGISAALGGFESLKWVFHQVANWRNEKRKNSAEAKEAEAVAQQQAATASQQEADLHRHELETAYQMLEQVKKQSEWMADQIESFKKEKEEDRKIKAELRMMVARHERIIIGIQRAWTEEMAKKRDAENHYCSDTSCTSRKPKIGSYSTPTVDLDAIIANVGRERERNKRGQFISKK